MTELPIVQDRADTKKKKEIRSLSLLELKEELVSLGEKAFRAKQIYHWLWEKSAHNFQEMTSLSVDLRSTLEEHFTINAVEVKEVKQSKDGTVKSAFRLHDGFIVEGVLIPSPDLERMTACVSSQVGCSLACSFCATGLMKRERNLVGAEIYDQVVLIKRQAEQFFNKPLTNIVYMGMGEPMLNYKGVLDSIDRITAEDGLNIASRRLTISTAGIAKMIRKLADDDPKVNLALSLHAANDTKRNEIMEINQSNSLEVLSEALRYYYQITGKKVTYEYIAFSHFNDSEDDAKELAEFCKIVPCKVNVIEYNSVEGLDFVKSPIDRLDRFQSILESKGVTVTIRRSRGKDIDAACGQLAIKNQDQ